MTDRPEPPAAPDAQELARLLTGDLEAALPDPTLRRLEPGAIFSVGAAWLQAESETRA